MSEVHQGWNRPADIQERLNRPSGQRCLRHELTYDGPAGAECPACILLEEVRKLQQENVQLRAVNKRTIDENRALKGIVDTKAKLAAAARIIGEADKLWLKEKLYEYKLSKKIVMKATHRRVDGEVFVNGFIAQGLNQEPDAYVCTSIGGAALATAYDEACSLHGISQAMGVMCDALYEILPAGGH